MTDLQMIAWLLIVLLVQLVVSGSSFRYNTMGHDEVLSAPMTILGMVNGMIGGLILLLPVYALNAGYLLTLIIIMFTGLFSYYSCYLCIKHMGDQPDLDYTILRHFNGTRWVKVFYDICVWSNLILIDMLYFELIRLQWRGLIPPHEVNFINPLVNGFVLLALVFILKYLELGASIMAYGIISIITYLIFLIWVVATYNQGNDSIVYKPFGEGAVNLAAAMGAAFSIQSFFIPVLKKNPNSHKYTFYTLIAYILGSSAYYYIAYVGSVGIWHRTYQGEAGGQQTIQGYFGTGAWQVNIIEAIYLIHLYSVFPEFMLVGKTRIFSIFGWKESSKGQLKLSQVIYFLIMVSICFVVTYFQVNINDIISINGAVIGFFFIYLIPAVLHIKCLYFSKGKRPVPVQSLSQQAQHDIPFASPPIKQIEMRQSKLDKIEEALEQGTQRQQPLIEDDTKSRQGQELQQGREEVEAEVDYSHFYCDCNLQTYSRKALVLDWIAIVVMVGLGIFIMVNGIINVAR